MLKKVYLVIIYSLASTVLTTAAEPIRSAVQAETNIQKSLNKYCIECHDDDLDEGDLRLDNFSDLNDGLKFEVLNRIEEQVYLELMPPKDEKVQPSIAERNGLLGAISAWNNLKERKSLFKVKLDYPEYGNYVDHDKLFSGKYKDLNGFTYDREWLISEFIFQEKVRNLINKGKVTNVDGEKRIVRGNSLSLKIANPFKLQTKSGVRYYANEKLNSSHFLSMTGNAEYLSGVMIGRISRTNKNYLPAVGEVSKMQFAHEAILKNRMAYLGAYIEKICEDVYQSSNESYLPKYSKIQLKGKISNEVKHYGKWGWRDRVGNDGNLIITGTNRFGKASKDKMAVLRLCERYWFHHGHDRETIERCLTIMMKEVATIMRFNKLEVDAVKISQSEKSIITSTVKKFRTKGITYQKLMSACRSHWRQEFQQTRESKNPLTNDKIAVLLQQLYEMIYERQPTQFELSENTALLRVYMAKNGINEAISKLTQTMILDSEFISRNEYGLGKMDQHGRKQLSPRDLSYAIAYALTDSSPDAILVKAVQEGRLKTKVDIKREVERYLKDRSHMYIIDPMINSQDGLSNITDLPVRKLRFFREFFGYNNALKVFKDRIRFGPKFNNTRERLVAEADLMVENILKNDKDVFNELLTTDKFYVFHSGDNDKTLQASEHLRKAYLYFKDKNWKSYKNLDDVKKHKDFLTSHGLAGLNVKDLFKSSTKSKPTNKKSKKKSQSPQHDPTFTRFINIMCDLEKKFAGKNKYIIPYNNGGERFGVRNRIGSRSDPNISGTGVATYYGINIGRWDYPAIQPAKIPNRMGILTHPAWLQAFSQNTHTDPVTRGKWVLEKLLAGTVPDVPIGVEAVIPEDHSKTLRLRLKDVTQVKECWKCHKLMNPLGNTFEMYDDFGRFRTEEELEHPKNALPHVKKPEVAKLHPANKKLRKGGPRMAPRIFYKTAPVVTTGVLSGTGNSKLDGNVKDAHDMIQRLSKSSRVRQSIFRHAFRYFMGRNEVISDSKTLIEADQAYLKSGGSFDAVIVSFLTSDSFIFRKERKE